MARPVFYDYWRSSACYRVRIALKLKGVDYETRQIDLRADEQNSAAYRAINPFGLVPMLEIDGHQLAVEAGQAFHRGAIPFHFGRVDRGGEWPG